MGLIDGEEAHISGAKGKLLRERLLAEFVGTFFLVLTIGIAVAGGGPDAPIAIGLMLGIQIYTFGSVSGGLFNPAVTLAVLVSGRNKITPIHALLYMLVQGGGALVGALISFFVTGTSFCFHYDKPHLNAISTNDWGRCFVLEMFFTMALAGAVLATGTSFDAPNHYFGFAIGCSVTAGAIASGGFDQGSFNPAVTFGINFVNYLNDDRGAATTANPDFGSWAIFLFCPFLGGLLAAAAFRGTRGEEYVVVSGAATTSNPKVDPKVSWTETQELRNTAAHGVDTPSSVGVVDVS